MRASLRRGVLNTRQERGEDLLPTLTQLHNEMIVYFGFDYPVPVHYQACMRFMAYEFADQWREREKQKRIGGKPLYESERAANESRTYENVAVGKYGEMFSSLCMYMFGYPDLSPDFAIYDPRAKSFAPDLPYRGRDVALRDVHVKSCDGYTVSKIPKKHGANDYSWLFHKSKPKQNGGDPLVGPQWQRINDLLVFVYTPSIAAQRIQLLATAPWNMLHPLLRDPHVKELREHKWALYFSDISDNATLYMARG